MNISSFLKVIIICLVSTSSAAKIQPFFSLDAGAWWAYPGYSQAINLFDNLGNTYLGNKQWKNNGTIILGVGLRTMNQTALQMNTSLRFLPMMGMSLSGEVQQLNSPQFQNLAYRYDVHSTLLLLDHIVTWNKHRLQPGLIAGIGAASNKTGQYIETPLNNYSASSEDHFYNGQRTHWAYELGAVLDYTFADVVFECAYRFIDAGRGQLGLNPSQNTPDHLSTGPLQYQTLSLGVRFYHAL